MVKLYTVRPTLLPSKKNLLLVLTSSLTMILLLSLFKTKYELTLGLGFLQQEYLNFVFGLVWKITNLNRKYLDNIF